jgi:hypothetical protein
MSSKIFLLVETCIQIWANLDNEIDFMREHRNLCRTFRFHVRRFKAVGSTAFGILKSCHPDSFTTVGYIYT